VRAAAAGHFRSSFLEKKFSGVRQRWRNAFKTEYETIAIAMPLVVVCGNPCTGKTTFSLKLEAYLKKQGVTNIEIINDESLGLEKNSSYANSFNEKTSRGTLKSAVDHKLSADRYVIVDSLNYIKGYRYELYCTARSFRTPHCVVWVECPTVISDEWNSTKNSYKSEMYSTFTISLYYCCLNH
jgi:protein KTI12